MLRLLTTLREGIIRAATGGRGIARVVNGIPLRVDPTSRHVFTPAYDVGATEYLRRQVAPGMEVWNVGANVGVYTLQLAHWVGPSGKVVAFEPNPGARAVLQRNIELNALGSRVEVVASAVGASSGSVDFFAAGTDGMSRAGRPNPGLQGTSRQSVPLTTLDAAAAARGRLPAVVVMDVEGWEIAALRGAASLLPSVRFVIELHPDAWSWSGHTRADLEAILRREGLEAVPVSGQPDPLGAHGQVVLARAEARGRL